MIKKNTQNKKTNTIIILLLIISILGSQSLSTFATTAMIGIMRAVKIDLGLTPVITQWLIVAYSIIASSLILISGQLGDIYGHFKTLIYGIAFSFVGCILFSIGNSGTLAMIATVLRGISTALIVPCSMSSLVIIVPKEKMKPILALWSLFVFLGWAIGPIIGGLCANTNWRIPYWISTGFFGLFLLIAIYYRKHFKEPPLIKKLDIIGSSLLFLGLITLILLLSEGPYWGWTSPTNITLYALSPILLILFFYSQTKVSNPILTLKVCKNKYLITSVVSIFSTVGCLFSYMYFVNYYFLSPVGQNKSYFFAGLVVSIGLSGSLISSFFANKLTSKYGYKNVLCFGFICIFSTNIILLWLPQNVSFTYLWWIFVINGIGCGIGFCASTPLCQYDIKPQDSGMTSGLFSTSAYLGASIIIPIAAVWYTHAEFSYIASSFKSLNLSLSHNDIIKISSAVHSNMKILKNTLSNFDLSNNQIHTVISKLKESAEIGFGRAGLVSAIFAAIGFVFCLFFAPGKSNNK